MVHFLKHLLRQLGCRLLVIWDGIPIHRDKAVKAFVAGDATEQLCLEQLPGYAPDLNPDEGVWNYLKHVELRNSTCQDLDDLHRDLRLAIVRLRRKSDVIRSFFKEAGY